MVIASENTVWLSPGNGPLQATTCYMESSISVNVLTEIQDSFGDKITMITAAIQPQGTHSQYEIEVADPLTDVVINNLLHQEKVGLNLIYLILLNSTWLAWNK